MRKIAVVAMLLFVVSLCVGPAALFAIMVENVGPDGSLTLEDGKEVSLVGVEMDAEGVSILRVLAQKQNVRVEILQSLKDEKGRDCVYAYLKAKSISLPFKETDRDVEEKILLNQFLLRLGAAKVKDGQEFSKKQNFLKVQEEAKKKGEGVWSYVDF